MKIYNNIKFFLLITNIIAENICKNPEWHANTKGQIFEYTSNANPPMPEIPIKIFPAELHEHGPSKITPFDLSKELQVNYPATTPNLLANFVRITVNQSIPTTVSTATSQAFYIIRGNGHSRTRKGTVHWEKGDLFVIPFMGNTATPVCQDGNQCVLHTCMNESKTNGCAIYWVNDSPLLEYLGVRPIENIKGQFRFSPSFFPSHEVKNIVNNLETIDIKTGTHKNRRGVLFGNTHTQQTKTLTPTLWSLLNVISPFDTQRAHKHNSVALDLAVNDGQEPYPETRTVWTAMGPELDSNGEIINPINITWRSGGVFVTPPGWWHSHHNTGTHDAWVLPIQDAGLYTHQRTLDIRFADDEAKYLRKGKHRGATINT